MKKLVSSLLAFAMLLVFSATAFAAEQPVQPASGLKSNQFFKNTSNYKINDLSVENQSSATRGWPGQGPAPQVTSVNVEKVGLLTTPGHENNVGVLVKVMGYGRDLAKYDGVNVNYFDMSPIILFGTTVDGFYYLYDCGAPTLGNHRFDITMTSTNSPYTKKTAWATFTINPNQ